MVRLSLILALAGLSSLPLQLPNHKFEVTEMKGGAVMTDFPGLTEMGQPLKWFVINDQSSPIRLENAGIVVSGNGNSSYASRGMVTTSKDITEVEVHFMLFDLRANHIKTLSHTENLTLHSGNSLLLDRFSFAKSGPWKAEAGEVKQLVTSVSFVARVRKSDGIEWVADNRGITQAIQGLKAKMTNREK
jgi:hypothetical protein